LGKNETEMQDAHDVFVLSDSVIITRGEKFVAICKFKQLQAEQNYRGRAPPFRRTRFDDSLKRKKA
jgi:hypothetical protein